MAVEQAKQEEMALALVRGHVYRLLAEGFRRPSLEQASYLKGPYLTAWAHWLDFLDVTAEILSAYRLLKEASAQSEAETLPLDYASLFEPHGGLAVSPYEGEHTKLTPQHALSQTYELADVCGFYNAFGLVPSDTAHERGDHIAIQLEFMHLLATKEAYAIEQKESEHREIVEDAQRLFLKEHLGRWTTTFANKIKKSGRSAFYSALSELLASWIELDTLALGQADDVLAQPFAQHSDGAESSSLATDLGDQ